MTEKQEESIDIYECLCGEKTEITGHFHDCHFPCGKFIDELTQLLGKEEK